MLFKAHKARCLIEHRREGLPSSNFNFILKTQFRCQKYSDLRIPFSVVRFPHTESNIPQNIFYSGIKGEFLRTAPSTLCLRAFIPKAKQFLERITHQGCKRCTTGTTGTSLRNIILAHLESFQNFSISCQDLLNTFSDNKL